MSIVERRAHFCERESAGCDDEAFAFHITEVGIYTKCVIPLNPGHRTRQSNIDPALMTFLQEHVDDLARRATTKELSELFLVEIDLVLPDKPGEILRRVPRERRFTEMRILRDEVLGGGVDVREVAPAPARDDYLAAELCVPLDDQNLTAALSGLDGAKETGRPAAYDYDVEFHAGIVIRANIDPSTP